MCTSYVLLIIFIFKINVIKISYMQSVPVAFVPQSSKDMLLVHASFEGWVQPALGSGFRTVLKTEKPFPQNNGKAII